MAEPVPTAPTGLVAIREDSGGISYVRPEDVAAAQAEGATKASAAEVDKDNYTRGIMGVGATADALARGATFGASDKLQVEAARLIGGDAEASQMAAKTRLLKEGYADTTGLSELAGGFLLPIPGGGAAKGIAGGLAKGAAVGLERAGLRGLAGVAEHVLPGALVAGYEGTVMGAGQALSESALGDQDLTAEKLFAHAGKGGLLGFGIGAALHGAGSAFTSKAAGGVERAAEREGVAVAERASPYRTSGALAEVAAVKTEGGMLAKLQSVADEEGYRALGGGSKDYKLLGKSIESRAERAQGIGQLLRDEGIVTATASKADMAERLAAKVEQTGQELGAMRKALDETGVKVATAPILERAQAEILAPLQARVGFGTEAKAVETYMREIGEKMGGETTFESLHKMRRDLDAKLKFDMVNAPGAVQELRKLRGIVEDEFTKAGEKASALKGGDFAEKYNFTKQKYSMLADAERAAKTGLDRKAVNRNISLTDTIMGAGAFATMGPLGLLAAAGNKVVREYGSQAASVALNHVAGLEMVQKAAQAVDSQMGRAVSSLGKGTKAASTRVSSAQAQTIAQTVLANPEALTARVKSFVGDKLRTVAPAVADSASTIATRAALHLQQTAPKPLPPVNALQPQHQRTVYQPNDVAKFAKRIEAIQDPMVLARGVASGNVSREHVEAVKAVYPRLFAVMQGRLMEEVAKLPKELPYGTRVALSVLFEVPLDASMQPKTIAGLQAQYTAPQKIGTPPPRPLNPASFRHNAPASARLEGPPGR